MASRVDPVVVIGGGIAGLACARVLADTGLPVRVLDRGHRVGGRMASRRIFGRPVDTGASYFTVSDPAFEAVVADWEQCGLARRWTDTFTVLGEGPPQRKSGPVRWGAGQGLRSLMADLARGLPVASGTEVRRVVPSPDAAPAAQVDGQPARAVVLAMPDPQARRLLPSGSAARTIVDRDFKPVLALIARWPERSWLPDLDGAFVSDDGVLAWVADDGRRRGDGAPVLVAHSTSGFARDHLAEPERASGPMIEALRRLLELPEPAEASVHRWSYAKPADPRDADHHLTAGLIGFCGDGWAAKPRVEGAYLSGRALGQALVDRLT